MLHQKATELLNEKREEIQEGTVDDFLLCVFFALILIILPFVA